MGRLAELRSLNQIVERGLTYDGRVARMTVSMLEQFTQTDPMPMGVGSAFESAYVYGMNRPTVMVDPSGLRGAVPSTNPVSPQPTVQTWSMSPAPRDWGRFEFPMCQRLMGRGGSRRRSTRGLVTQQSAWASPRWADGVYDACWKACSQAVGVL